MKATIALLFSFWLTLIPSFHPASHTSGLSTLQADKIHHSPLINIHTDSAPLPTPALWIIIPIIILSFVTIIVGYILPMIRRLPLKPFRRVTPVLFIKRGQQTVKRFTLKKIPCLIGRDPSNEIYLNDPQLDHQHAKILELSTGYGLVDLGSKQGTFLNGKPVPTQPILLRSGDEVRVGDVLLVFGM